jgi:hypothetical protein
LVLIIHVVVHGLVNAADWHSVVNTVFIDHKGQ